uniref:Leishmanolysin-like peptidase n=1 Tax=Neobodo designis TaxID=312471 RepID=A0A7S1QT20_NEODS
MARAVSAAIAVLGVLLAATVRATVLDTVSAANSRVVCHYADIIAGYPNVCDAYLRDASNQPWGTEHDACQLFFTWCGTVDKNSPGPLRNATFLGNGHYRIVFHPTTAGWNSLGASIGGNAVSVSPSMMLVHPATISGYHSTSTCHKTMGITKCNVKHRDAFGNVVSACASYSTESSLQPLATCQVMS